MTTLDHFIKWKDEDGLTDEEDTFCSVIWSHRWCLCLFSYLFIGNIVHESLPLRISNSRGPCILNFILLWSSNYLSFYFHPSMLVLSSVTRSFSPLPSNNMKIGVDSFLLIIYSMMMAWGLWSLKKAYKSFHNIRQSINIV